MMDLNTEIVVFDVVFHGNDCTGRTIALAALIETPEWRNHMDYIEETLTREMSYRLYITSRLQKVVGSMEGVAYFLGSAVALDKFKMVEVGKISFITLGQAIERGLPVKRI